MSFFINCNTIVALMLKLQVKIPEYASHAAV
jgi:hypothetical protein